MRLKGFCALLGIPTAGLEALVIAINSVPQRLSMKYLQICSITPQGSGAMSYLFLNHQNSARGLTCGRSLEMICEQMNE